MRTIFELPQKVIELKIGCSHSYPHIYLRKGREGRKAAYTEKKAFLWER